MHVRTCIHRVVGETDGVARFLLATHHCTVVVLVVQEGAEAHTQSTRNLNQRRQRGDVNIIFNTRNLFFCQPRALCEFCHADFAGFTKRLNLCANNLSAIHSFVFVK